jgi:hypothetical protein
MSSTGTVLNSLTTGRNLSDIDVAADGRIVVGSWWNEVFFTSTGMEPVRSIPVAGGDAVHVAFTSPVAPVPEPGTWVPVAIGFCMLAVRRRMTR